LSRIVWARAGLECIEHHPSPIGGPGEGIAVKTVQWCTLVTSQNELPSRLKEGQKLQIASGPEEDGQSVRGPNGAPDSLSEGKLHPGQYQVGKVKDIHIRSALADIPIGKEER
jgi:hypothetical protein